MAAVKNKKLKILIADDSEMNRAILVDILKDKYDAVEAEDGAEAVKILRAHSADIALVLLDINMPKLNGFDVLEVMNKNKWIEEIPVIIISAENASYFTERAYALGVTDYISRPFDVSVVQHRVINTLMLYEKQKMLMDVVEEQIYQRQKNNSMMINILSHIVEFGNAESGPHIQHIRIITEILLKGLNEVSDQYNFSHEEIALICTASALHDIGKVSIPSEILNKPGRLTDEEFAIMKTHSAIGASILDKLPLYKDEPLVKTARAICRWHHERYDGRGYPDRLLGDEIPIAAQIVALADVYDALTSERVYKAAYSHEKAIEMIKNGECGSFNPLLIKVLDVVADELYAELHSDTGETDDVEVRQITAEVLSQKQISASGRTIAQLEKERNKYMIFASLSDEVIFELSYSPYMITFLNGGGRRVGTSEIVVNPLDDEGLNKCCGKSRLQDIALLFSRTTPENPTVTYEAEILLDNTLKNCKLVAQTMWSDDEKPEIVGAVGKISPV